MFPTTHFHPMMVHFPIALIAVGFLAELIFMFQKKEICFTKMGFFLLLLGTVAALAAWITGGLFTSEMAGAAGELRERHEIMATITVIISVVTLILRTLLLFRKNESKTIRITAFVLFALAATAVSITGFLGGNLVYGYMMPL